VCALYVPYIVPCCSPQHEALRQTKSAALAKPFSSEVMPTERKLRHDVLIRRRDAVRQTGNVGNCPVILSLNLLANRRFCSNGSLTYPRIRQNKFASELYRPRDCRLLSKLLPTFADRGRHVVSVTDPYCRILGFLDSSCCIFFQVAPKLYSRG
jgi:hypothetical protein